MPELVAVKHSELPAVRQQLIEQQAGTCPLTGLDLTEENWAVDHQHVVKSREKVGENGAGLIRGVLDYRANALEGKIQSDYQRMGLRTIIALPDFLRRLADYLEKQPTNFIHPNDVPRKRKLSKTSYNSLKTAYRKKYNKPLNVPYPTRGGISSRLEKLFQKFDIEPKFNQ